MKTCTKCGALKPLDQFYVSRGKVYPSCKECHQAHQRAYRAANVALVREQAKVSYRKRTYDLDPEMLEKILGIQGGLCAICEERPAIWIDHDHRTGLVRGLLCKPCNWALGHLKDDPDIVRRALLYLLYYEGVQQDAVIDEIHRSLVGNE